ncbi:diguanylate cyclase [Eubacteriales bacterium OttesenSCG-928-N14]|nr:diguanylate cyclase [Eubacteriales bacterium OttesenSCG-928-N14]
MQQEQFNNLFAGLHLPVIITNLDESFSVIYMNQRSALMFMPSQTIDQIAGNVQQMQLRDVVRFESDDEFSLFTQSLAAVGHINGYHCNAITFDGNNMPISIYGNLITDGQESYALFYLLEQGATGEASIYDNRLMTIINSALIAENVDASINMILAITGQQMDVDRVYIFEEISPTMTRNTYEWCAPGVEPAIQDLQFLPKADYNYDIIVSSGMFITNDVSTLPEEAGREILEMQGIMALAIITLYDGEKTIGYVGYDDVKSNRVWDHDEIQFLQGITAVLTLLIKRRKAEEDAERTLQILQLISDNSGDVIYANTLDDYKIIFVSKALSDLLGKEPDELIGQVCYEAFQRGFDGPCPYCPIPHINLKPDEDRSGVYVWEHVNPITNKTYLAKDNIIRWVDGSFVHVETAVDISRQKEQEAMLQYFASTDTMTGISNREWGARTLSEKLEDENITGTLCFIDLDGLKYTNDTYGHEAGDAFLMDCVMIIQSHMMEDEFLCRWGGDEFLVWLNGTVEYAQEVMADIERDMEGYNGDDSRQYKLSFSYGIVPFIGGIGENFDALVTKADALMYQNKIEKKGLNRRRRRDDRVE